MRNALVIVAVAASLLSCSKSSTPPTASASAPTAAAPSTDSAKSADPVSQKVEELAGSGAGDCGHVRSQAQEQTQKASDCAMQAAKAKKSFHVVYDMPGLTVGYAGNSQGKMFSVQAEQPENASAKAEVKTTPCPAELRVAQSGRVTCMALGAGMGTVGGANPHGGMLPSTGQNPHGGISMPDLGTPNPHGTAQPSHPPAGKTPPKQ
ncbi:MAG: hypothetical protein LAN64_09460 [Acidobacteriia bacterium]|nr:hypothetical protein [Terriglobia bacterium]